MKRIQISIKPIQNSLIWTGLKLSQKSALFLSDFWYVNPNLVIFALLIKPSNSSNKETNKTLLGKPLSLLLKGTQFKHQQSPLSLILNIQNLSLN